MKENIIAKKSYSFAIKIIEFHKCLINEHKEYTVSKQLLRSGTSIGAQIRESIYAQSKADFVHKLSIALKEASEAEYWLMLLNDTNYLENDVFSSLHKDCIELIKLLTSSIKTSKGLNN